MRIGIIGTGIVGASVGWHLSRRGAEVLFFDRGDPGQATSAWTLSWVNASTKLARPGYFDLNLEGLESYYEMARLLRTSTWWHSTGYLRWSEDAGEAQQLAEHAARLRAAGYEAELLDARTARKQLEPAVSFPTMDTPVVFCPREGWVDGPRCVAEMVDDATARGAQTRFGVAVRDVIVAGDRVKGLVLDDGDRVPLDAVVNAAGPDAGAVAGLVGRLLPMQHSLGFTIRVSCGTSPVRRVLQGPRAQLRPDSNGCVLASSKEVEARLGTGDLTMSQHQAAVHELAVALCPALEHGPVVGARIVGRPIPGDGYPSVGGLEQLGGYFEAVAHSGITLAPVLGRLLAREIVDEIVDPLVSSYRPGRFGAIA